MAIRKRINLEKIFIKAEVKETFRTLIEVYVSLNYKPLKKLPKINLEQLKKYKPTELAPGVKKKTN